MAEAVKCIGEKVTKKNVRGAIERSKARQGMRSVEHLEQRFGTEPRNVHSVDRLTVE
ncbi:hypothetical protein QUB63_32970 [Microcoleus sp. ARI1-B5]|uniref:hypothetical protein n=1 Tax=unclassified Microcoleus TaxID=2642155 RepID=UPI002FD043FD